MSGHQSSQPRAKTRPAALAAVLSAALMLAGAIASPAGIQATAYTIVITKSYDPSPLTVYAGQTVIWKNDDTVSHWVWPDSGGFAKSGEIKPGGSYSVVLHDVGTFGYHDAMYSFMHGTLVVETPPKTPTPTRAPTPRPTLRRTAAPVARTAATPKPTVKSTAKPSPTASPTEAAAAAASAPNASAGPGATESFAPGLAGPTSTSGPGGGGLDWPLVVIAVIVAGVLAFLVGRLYQLRRPLLAAAGPDPQSPTAQDLAEPTVVIPAQSHARAPTPGPQKRASKPKPVPPAPPAQPQDLSIPAWLRRRQGPLEPRGRGGRAARDPDDLPLGSIPDSDEEPAGGSNDREDDL